MRSYLVTIATNSYQTCVKMCLKEICAQLLKTAGAAKNSQVNKKKPVEASTLSDIGICQANKFHFFYPAVRLGYSNTHFFLLH